VLHACLSAPPKAVCIHMLRLAPSHKEAYLKVISVHAHMQAGFQVQRIAHSAPRSRRCTATSLCRCHGTQCLVTMTTATNATMSRLAACPLGSSTTALTTRSACHWRTAGCGGGGVKNVKEFASSAPMWYRFRAGLWLISIALSPCRARRCHRSLLGEVSNRRIM
jgi:hypothetical protein